jgi:hypothetical protein
VHNTLRVRGSERIGDLKAEVEYFGKGQWALLDTRAKRVTFQAFHRDEWTTPIHADVIDRADMRMVKARERLGFTSKSRKCQSIDRDVAGEELQREESGQAEVLRLVNHPHAAFGDLGSDFEVPDGLAYEGHDCSFLRSATSQVRWVDEASAFGAAG